MGALLFSVVMCFSAAHYATADELSTRSELQQDTAVSNLAHRGASGLAPENTYASWDMAWKQGADYIELDVQMTADGELVALHDATLDRTSRGPAEDCSGAVANKTLEQLRACEVGSWFNDAYPERARPEYVGLAIPSVEDVFRRYGREANYYVELKNSAPAMEQELIRLLNEFDLRRPAVREWRVVIQSFSPDALQRIHATNPRIPLSRLFGPVGAGEVRAALPATSDYAVVIGPEQSNIDQSLVRDAHLRGLKVHTWTVDDAATMSALIEMGVDGIFTNFPRRLRRLP